MPIKLIKTRISNNLMERKPDFISHRLSGLNNLLILSIFCKKLVMIRVEFQYAKRSNINRFKFTSGSGGS